jgi:Ca-activated chloride channel family protein
MKKPIIANVLKESRLLLAIVTLAVLLGGVFAGRSRAAGLLIADGGLGGVLEIEEHDVQVSINNGVAVTRVIQVFRNTEKRQVEALYTFPVPRGASVANFSMWINGREMVGEVVEKKRARQIYNSYKKKRRDPGLLEQVDYKTFEMRVFPIAAGARQKVQIVYYQELGVDSDQVTYVYPLATVARRDVDARATGKFAINVDIKSAVPITAVDSPSHPDGFVVARQADTLVQASLESVGGSLASDVVVHYALSRPRTGIDLITSRTAGQDGYFMLTLTAGKELAAKNTGMDYVFLLDISGSMAHDAKLVTSKRSVEAFINELDEGDRFEVMTFNVSPHTLFGGLRPAAATARQQARIFLTSRQARGGTVLAPAMTTAYKYSDPDRTLNVVILSDGMTEQKERRALLELIGSRPRNTRVFCIGVGNEVNRPLLEQLADDSGGLAAFISRGDDFKRQARAFRRKLMHPVATDLDIRFDGIQVYDVEPRILPNLYHGAPVRIYGRYQGKGTARVSLKASVQGVELDQTTELPFPAKDGGNPEIERMWAFKRVSRLLKKADRTGTREQVTGEVIRLAEEYSIVTEYSSFLVLENDAEYRRWKIQRRNAARLDRDRRAQNTRQEALEAIRRKAVADLGPQPGRVSRNGAATKPAAGKPPARVAQPSSVPAIRPQSRDINLGVGTGPVGPLFVAAACWLRRRKKKK